MSKTNAFHCDTHGTRFLLVKRLEQKPDADIADLSRYTGQSRSNTWHHLRILEKRGVRIHGKPLTDILKALIEHSNFLRAEGSKHRHKSARPRVSKSELNERINNIARNAERHLSDDAISYRTANGITVVVQKRQHWISME